MVSGQDIPIRDLNRGWAPNLCKIPGWAMENHGKTMGKPWENGDFYGKSTAFFMGTRPGTIFNG